MIKKFKFINLAPLVLAALAAITIIVACGKGITKDIDDEEDINKSDWEKSKTSLQGEIKSIIVALSSSKEKASSSSEEKSSSGEASSSSKTSSNSGSSSSSSKAQSSNSGENVKCTVGSFIGTEQEEIPDSGKPEIECLDKNNNVIALLDPANDVKWVKNNPNWLTPNAGNYSNIEIKVYDDVEVCGGLSAICSGTLIVCPQKGCPTSSSATAASSSSATAVSSSSSATASSSSVATYTITYRGNSNTGGTAPAEQTKTAGQAVTLSGAGTLTRTGYTFNGWNTVAGGTGTAYAAGASYTANADITLYAQWRANTYTVTYSANSGTGAPAAQTKTHDVALTLSSTRPTRTGYNFVSWNTAAGGTGTTYAPGASYTANADVTLYAQWSSSSAASSSSTTPSSSSVASSSSAVQSSSSVVANTCDYQATWCNGKKQSEVPKVPDGSEQLSGEACFFATEITKFCANGETTKVNGISVSNVACWNNSGTLPAKADGGYYIYIPQYATTGAWAGSAASGPNKTCP